MYARCRAGECKPPAGVGVVPELAGQRARRCQPRLAGRALWSQPDATAGTGRGSIPRWLCSTLEPGATQVLSPAAAARRASDRARLPRLHQCGHPGEIAPRAPRLTARCCERRRHATGLWCVTRWRTQAGGVGANSSGEHRVYARCPCLGQGRRLRPAGSTHAAAKARADAGGRRLQTLVRQAAARTFGIAYSPLTGRWTRAPSPPSMRTERDQ
jgi:hypothetical protein